MCTKNFDVDNDKEFRDTAWVKQRFMCVEYTPKGYCVDRLRSHETKLFQKIPETDFS